MLYELQTLMVPIVNFTHSTHEDYPVVLANALKSVLAEASLPLSWAHALARLPWRGPGCTGIIARNSADGTVSHARDLDFSPAILGNLVCECRVRRIVAGGSVVCAQALFV